MTFVPDDSSLKLILFVTFRFNFELKISLFFFFLIFELKSMKFYPIWAILFSFGLKNTNKLDIRN